MTLRSKILNRVSPPEAAVFQRAYVVPCRPVVLRGMAGKWPAMSRWSLDYFQSMFGATPVTTLRATAGRVIMDEKNIQDVMQLGEFIDALRAGSRDRYMTSRLAELPERLRHDAPAPIYCAKGTWQNGNLWIGAEGTIARTHRDLADNLHALVSGRKRFTLVAPRHSSCLYPNALLDSFPNGCHVDIENPDFTRFPRMSDVELLVADLDAGDTIYIPRRWWHHARTLALSVSVNFWWASSTQRLIVQAADYLKSIRGLSR